MKTKIAEIDAIVHQERINSSGGKVTFEMNIAEIPDGSFVLINSVSYLLHQSSLYEWTPFGYKKPIPLPSLRHLTVLTPQSFVQTFRAGYIPTIELGKRID